ncbi:MAG: response regulator transcription factor [Chitinophagaceae bacterium]|jgi:DNA-binding response OmpR family regulator|nr:response regulator transcription factor [Chitinophagaceae bacterium]
MHKKPLILFVEDDLELGPLLMRVLGEHGYTTQWVTSAEDALQLMPAVSPDLIICDRMLPGMDGLSFCKRVRSLGHTLQILMLTALNAESNMVEGLDAGADDYLGKPFSYQVLLAKLRAMLRRVAIAGTQEVLQLADLTLQVADRSVQRAGTVIKLTAREFHLLYYLLRHKGQVKSRAEILEAVWGFDFDPGTNVVDVYLNYLRNKIDKPFDHKLLHTYIGMGYALRETP